ncbi:MAG: hypothetical protein COU29_02935 [Candidatus Magasanikbacteria bacterium CG10_big_fil_rev_8_21_14_0_10_36_32]|uniref:Gcp-like domain-containing protein n=1 Tax=Candidatus Magasanikbacteria bacterium CG10_big_fil_rev_8_21_14_0_10_36_32 TaxID=1974646 RepID=A0A2M6W5Z1_9BACT|nr:MAG: hypothetical protein COU29_02935 [Candidatus Magasanikbacteria bacterium CG10_big_fil_rev_8_21_14_0_10_36_32]
MYFIVDNSADDKVIFSYTERENWKKIEFIRPGNNKVSLLFLLDKFFKKTKFKLSDVEGMGVIVGKGKFTSTRIAVTMINTLAYVLKIPAVGVLDDYKDLLRKIKTAKSGVFISAKYSADATIGKRKK